MRVTRDMIDPELRRAGSVAKLLFRPTAGFFRLARRLGRRMEGRNVPGLQCNERQIESIDEGVQVRVRTYRPPSPTTKGLLPGVLFLHGGGYAMANPEAFASSYEQLIRTRDCVIVAPDYRKSVDAPYPAAVNDCYATLLWLKKNAAELGVHREQIIVMGGSAGGGLTAAVTLMARDRGEVHVSYQMPLYPMMDDRMTTHSMRDNDAPLWSARHNRVAWDLYLGGLSGDEVPKYAAPARETDYTGLPPTTTFVGALDPFRDETTQYVEQLRAAGVPVEFRIFDGCYHGFELIQPNSKPGRAANEFLCARFAAAVDGAAK
jgi:acetyl esterase/lipase